MSLSGTGSFGYTGLWARIDLTARKVRIEPADPAVHRDYVGGRGVQARLIHEHLRSTGPLKDPLSPGNRIVVGSAALNDTAVPTAGRGSCSFISPMTVSPDPAPWVAGHKPVSGLIAHSSAGGLFPNMLKRAGIDHLIIDGRADRPVRILVNEGKVEILDAEDELFETVDGRKVARTASAITDALTRKYPGSSTMCLGPAGWNQVAYACLTGDRHRNFGRGGAGAVFGSKNLVAVTAYGRQATAYYDAEAFTRLAKEIDGLVKTHVADPKWTASFRPTTGTTWWLDRAFDGKYLGKQGGYLPWHNFDEGWFPPEDQAKVGTDAFLAISGKHSVCNRCRHVMCTRSAKVEAGPYAGDGVRPEFETVALWINCCILDRDALFHMNYLCNEYGIDTMTLGSVMAGAMDLAEKGFMAKFAGAPAFGSAPDMVRTLKDIAYRTGGLGDILARPSDRVVAEVGAANSGASLRDIARCVTTAYGGLGYAGIEPKAFPGMFAAYGTSNRGRGDHTYAWTIQAEEGGLEGAGNLAAYVAGGQAGKALVDSMGLCDFFTEDHTSEMFLALHHALTGLEYTTASMTACGRRIYALERHINNGQGRVRAYDSYVPPKLTVPMTGGGRQGRAVDEKYYGEILDAYYEHQGWTKDGVVPPDKLKELGIS
jgi:aldehyde:ferredoxin oxidoreductase